MTSISSPFVGDLTELHITSTRGGTADGTTLVGNVALMGNIGYDKNIVEFSAFGTAFKSKVPGKKNLDAFTAQINYDPSDTDHALFKSGYDGTASQFFTIVWRLGAENMRADFEGYIKTFNIITEEEDIVRVDVEIAITGDVDLDTTTDVAL